MNTLDQACGPIDRDIPRLTLLNNFTRMMSAQVLRGTPKGTAAAAASTPAKAAGAMSVAMHTPAKSADEGQPVSGLESAFNRLEAQEAAAAERGQKTCKIVRPQPRAFWHF